MSVFNFQAFAQACAQSGSNLYRTSKLFTGTKIPNIPIPPCSASCFELEARSKPLT